MDNKVVLDFINDMLKHAEKYNLSEDDATALEIATQAVKKQIAEETVYDPTAKLMPLRCPVCKAGMTGYEHYCDNCGQALLWGDKDYEEEGEEDGESTEEEV